MLPKQHGAYSPIAHESRELPSHNSNLVDHDLWKSSAAWTLTIEHQPSDQFGYSIEYPQPWTGLTSRNDDRQATNISSPSDDWSLNLPLDTMCEHDNPSTPPTATPCPMSPRRNFVEPTETLELKRQAGRSRTSPNEGPRPQTKRNMNTLSAAKSRKRAKRGENDLQRRERDLLSENRMLKVEIGFLREEVLQLKSEILLHGNCENDYIRNYIQKAAKEIGASAEDD
ncbi:hypothetical protein F4679DRAFT_509129 [Xylaria curta]|nr:hypothetical protein F4679DRAFT_509129 [Xylaria curta]